VPFRDAVRRGSWFWALRVAERICLATAALLLVTIHLADMPRPAYVRSLLLTGVIVMVALIVFRGALPRIRHDRWSGWGAVGGGVAVSWVIYATLIEFVPTAHLFFIPFIVLAALLATFPLAVVTAGASVAGYLVIAESMGYPPTTVAAFIGSATFMLTGIAAGVLSEELREHYSREEQEHRRAASMTYRLGAVVDAVEEAIVFTDLDGIVQMMNARARELFDLPSGGAIGASSIELARHIARLTEDPEGYMETLQELRDDVDAELKWQVEQIIPERRNLDVLSRPARDDSGARIGRVEVFIDVTDAVRRAADVDRLYQEARSTAESYQRAFLPRLVPSLPRVGLVAHYIPAAGRRAVCGDFYDFLTLPDGRVGVVMGDPCGVGPPAVSDAALARFTLASLARDQHDPAELLRLAQGHVGDRLGMDRFVRVLVAILDPERAVLEYASAGHVPPMLYRSSTGTVEMLSSEGLPLGVSGMGPNRYEAGRTALQPGDMLFLYTDGVTEAARNGRPFGQGRLMDMVRDYGIGTPGELVQGVRRSVEAWIEGELRDDLAMVACQVVPDSTAGEPQRELVLPNEPSRIREVRAFVGEFLADLRVPVDVISDLLLVTGEAAGNAVRYGRRAESRSELRVACRLVGVDIEIAISDDGAGFEVSELGDVVLPDPLASGGRGLFLMHKLSDRVAIESSDEGTTVKIVRRAFAEPPLPDTTLGAR
jgi:serine phosphatase RsbU (regulator of sigma subunit)/anti-sigma regulatory factor (Ser/Thr protein kinase)